MKHPNTTRKRQSGSVEVWILLIILILIALVPLVLYFSHVLQYSLGDSLPGYIPPEGIEDGPFLDPPESGITDKIVSADFSGAEELKLESENEAAEQVVQP